MRKVTLMQELRSLLYLVDGGTKKKRIVQKSLESALDLDLDLHQKIDGEIETRRIGETDQTVVER